MSDKIQEIRARHEEGIRAGVDADRAYLLAEVQRLREVLLNISQYETSAPAGFEWDVVVDEIVEIARRALAEGDR